MLPCGAKEMRPFFIHVAGFGGGCISLPLKCNA